MTAIRRPALTTAPPVPILPYPHGQLQVQEHDPRTLGAAERLIALIRERRSTLAIHHVGSSAVAGLAGKNVVDLAVAAEPEDIPGRPAPVHFLPPARCSSVASSTRELSSRSTST